MPSDMGLPVQRRIRKTFEESNAHLEELGGKSQTCKEKELTSISAGMAANLAGDAATAASSIPLLGAPFATGSAAVAAASHVVQGGLDIARVAMDCSSVPFDEIKEIMDRKFNEVNRKLDQNAAALSEISDMLNKTLSAVENVRYEMAEGFNDVLNSIKDTREDIRKGRVEPIITQINNIAEFFEGEKKRLGHLKKQEFIFLLEQPDYLNFLKDSRTSKADSLQTSIFAIIDQGFAVPQNSEDKVALNALYALYYGIQTFIEMMYFLLDKYRYLADYYYEKGDLTKFNKYFILLKLTIQDFKYSFLGLIPSKGKGSLNAVIRLLQIANEKDLDVKKETQINEQIETLN